jgi:hypothetical protein
VLSVTDDETARMVGGGMDTVDMYMYDDDIIVEEQSDDMDDDDDDEEEEEDKVRDGHNHDQVRERGKNKK